MQTYEPPRQSGYNDSPELLPPRILLAEDDTEKRALVSAELRQAGYGVVECTDGAALVQRFNSASRTQALGVDLRIADVFMLRLTELGVLYLLRCADPFTPCIVITTLANDETHRAAARLGAIAVLAKPFEIKDLLHLVGDAIGVPSRKPL